MTGEQPGNSPVDVLGFILDVLRLKEEYDSYGEPIHWRLRNGAHWPVGNPDMPITFWCLCNDLFWWASADAEQVEPGDIPALRQAILNVEATGVYTFRFEAFEMGCLLWCARKRGMRPQRPAYPKDERLRGLFDACGPERSPREEDWF